MATEIPEQRFENVTCPFCGLLCDDLTISANSQTGSLRVLENGCPISRPAFAGLSAEATAPRIDGKSATLQDAIARAAEILRGARQPFIGGLATDLGGMRAALALADRCGAVVDHMNSAANFRNLAVLQDSGWVTTTFAEIRNRADFILVVGTDVVSRFPRFFERMVWPAETMFAEGELAREIVYLGAVANVEPANVEPGASAAGIQPGNPPSPQSSRVACANPDLGEVIGALRMLINGRALAVDAVAGVPRATLRALAAKIRDATYGVAIWAAADLDFPHAELTVQSLCEMLKDLNRTGRFCGLPLGGSDGDLTANQVSAWQSGYALRTSFGRGYPSYDPYHHSSQRLLAANEIDALIWISSFDTRRLPPPTDARTIVLGRIGMTFEREPQVYIPIATPGADHVGHLFRSDNVVALPLRKLRNTRMASAADILTAIENKFSFEEQAAEE
ncbi:MAG: formylmethanofuran dehydrogenase subunit B [Burkholderiales bacterium]|nr:formylmethanofuran dehydrogenase subunit B [Burkholderiales bacterium]